MFMKMYDEKKKKDAEIKSNQTKSRVTLNLCLWQTIVCIYNPTSFVQNNT